MSGPSALRNKQHKPRQNGRGGKITTAATLISKVKRSAVRLMESVRRMDINILKTFLHTSASANSNENILLCCKILEHRKKLTLLQELAIVHCMYTTITQREVTMSNMLMTADTLDSILTDSENAPELERMALMCQITLTKWIPQSISSKIVNLFTVPSIPEEIVFWAIHQMTIQYGPEMEPYLDLILRTFFPVMKTASTINQKYWFSLGVHLRWWSGRVRFDGWESRGEDTFIKFTFVTFPESTLHAKTCHFLCLIGAENNSPHSSHCFQQLITYLH
ncbi:uncharacterized protein LOC144790844 [Lissotriton helveticus]